MDTQKVRITINNKEYMVDASQTILEAAKSIGIDIPSFCYRKDVSKYASCGVCVVEVKGAKNLVRSCITPVRNDMVITTNSARVQSARRINVELLLASHPQQCLTCDKNEICELRKLAGHMNITNIRFAKGKKQNYNIDNSSFSIVRDANKCVLCHRCVDTCSVIQSVSAIDVAHRGIKSKISAFMDKGLGDTVCIGCGQCIHACPTGALVETSSIPDIWRELQDSRKHVIVEIAPAVRAAIGEEFGLPAGSLVTGKMVSAFKKLGFAKVLDTQFSADLTIIEEGHELLHRLTSKGQLPLITSCSPGWIQFIEYFYPEFLDHVSTCKSPQQMFGAVAKTYYAEKLHIDPQDIVVVSIMPCTAKKFECKRPEMKSAYKYWKEKGKKFAHEFYDVDYILTTREAAKMIREAGIDFVNLEEELFDMPLGTSTGAATIFGATGGVMEAALRTVYEVLTGRPVPFENLDITPVRGLEGIREASITLENVLENWKAFEGVTLKIAIANSTGNARKIMDIIKQGKAPWHFIEIMACPNGCIGGGGQPIPTTKEICELRAKALYQEDKGMKLRKSHENPEVKTLYAEFLGKPLGELSHELLHTHYHSRKK